MVTLNAVALYLTWLILNNRIEYDLTWKQLNKDSKSYFDTLYHASSKVRWVIGPSIERVWPGIRAWLRLSKEWEQKLANACNRHLLIKSDAFVRIIVRQTEFHIHTFQMVDAPFVQKLMDSLELERSASCNHPARWQLSLPFRCSGF